MAENGTLPTRQHRGGPSPLGRYVAATDRVDGWVEEVQSGAPQAAADRAGSHPEVQQLLAGNDAILAFREAGDQAIWALRLHLDPDIGLRCKLGGHGTRLAGRPSEVARCRSIVRSEIAARMRDLAGLGYGPGVRSTAASAVAASASRTAAPSSAFESART